MEKKVITVLGKAAPENLGIVDAHNHLWISAQDLPGDNAPVLERESEIISELIAYRKAGGGAQIDCQPPGAGRDARRLRKVSQKSGVAVVAATGFHLQRYYPPDSKIWEMDSSEAAEYFRSEIRDGLEETRNDQVAYPGLIKIAVEETLDQSPIPLLRAAAEVSRESGLAVEMHTEKGADIEKILKFFEAEKLEPSRLVICHLDKRPDLGLHLELASGGYRLEYDTFFRAKYDPEKNLWPLVENMVAEGFSGSLVLATDQADPEMWAFSGNSPGLPGFISVIKKRLDDEIRDPVIVNNLVGGNISRILAV